jgi:hypothetical protein
MAIELENVVVPQLMLRDDRLERFKEQRQLTEGMLSILILASSLPQLREMEAREQNTVYCSLIERTAD